MKNFPPLNLPPCDLRVRPDTDSRRGGYEVFDTARRRWVALTPEEWVRQHFVHYLQTALGYPSHYIANEVAIDLNGLSRRSDTVVYDRSLRPVLLVEYKAPSVAVTQKVFDQIARYNIVIGARVLVVSNGLQHYCCRFDGSTYTFLPGIPRYSAL